MEKATGPVAETTATVMLRLMAFAGTSMKSSLQAPPRIVAVMPAPVSGGWRSRKIPKATFVPT